MILCPFRVPAGWDPTLLPWRNCVPLEEATRFNKETTSFQLSCWIFPKNSSNSFWFLFFCFDNDLITTSFDQKHKLFLCASYFENTLLAFIICLWSLKIYFVSFSQTNPSAFWQGWDLYLPCSRCVKQCLEEKNNLMYCGHIHSFNWECQTCIWVLKKHGTRVMDQVLTPKVLYWFKIMYNKAGQWWGVTNMGGERKPP